MSAREELRAEERKLDRLLNAPRPDGSKTKAAMEALRATADNVRRLRLRAGMEPTPREHARTLAARRELEAEQKAKREESAKREPARKAARALLAFADPALVGARLDASRLTPAEGKELLALVELRRSGELSGRKRARLEKLAGTLAGEPALYERRRQEAESTAAETPALEGARDVYLPAYLLRWLETPDALSVTELGVLAAVLLSLENGRTPFYGSEVRDGAIILGGGSPFQLAGNVDNELSARAVADAVRYLADAGWLELDTAEGRTRITPGKRAKMSREVEAKATVT